MTTLEDATIAELRAEIERKERLMEDEEAKREALEDRFRAALKSAREEFAGVEEERKALMTKIEAISEKYGIPFEYDDVDQYHDGTRKTYTPKSWKEHWEPLTPDDRSYFAAELASVYGAFNKVGWYHSAIC